MKNHDMNFQKFPMTNGTAISGSSGTPPQRITLRGIPKFSEVSHREFPFPLASVPEIPEFLIEWFTFRKFNNFLIFRKFLRKFPNFLSPVFEFSKFYHRMVRACHVFSKNNATISLQIVKARVTFQRDQSFMIWKFAFDNLMFYRETRNRQ